MLNNLKARRDEEDGFMLIELMVVVLIIAILIAIAIPTFLGARTRTQNRAAQSSLRNALTAAKTAYTDQSSYATATALPADLPTIEPSLKYVDGTVLSADIAGPPVIPSFKVVSVDVVAGNQTWEAAVLSKSGTCYWIKDVSSGGGAGTFYGTGAAAACHGTDASAAAAASW